MFSKLSSRQFLLLASVVIALWAGLTAVALKTFVHFLQVSISSISIDAPWIYFVSPMVGILLTILFIKIFNYGHLDSGTSHVLFAIAKKSSALEKSETYSHAVTSALTVGLGGSAGLESPIVQTGSAIGATFASFFPVGYRERTLMLACGAAAGIAAAFNAPIAGVLFALEVLLVDIHIASFIPLLLAGAIGALCSKIILDEQVVLSFSNVTPFNYYNIPFYALLGILCGLMSIFYVQSLLRTQKLMRAIPPVGRWLTGGILLGALIMVFPPLFSEGYVHIRSLTSMSPGTLFQHSIMAPYITSPIVVVLAVLVMAFIKVFAVSFTLGAGGNGGNFAPSLFVGACLGFSYASLLVDAGSDFVSVSNFCLVGMAGMLAAVFHAPLMAIFLIAELTGGYGLMIPLMVVVALSTATSWFLKKKSLDETILRQRVMNFRFDQDTQLLSRLKLSEFIESDFVTVSRGASLRSLVDVIAKSKRNIIPVIDEWQQLDGVIILEDIRDKMFDTSLYDVMTVKELMRKPQITIEVNEEMSTVMEKFDKANVWNMPVVNQGRYVGFVSKSSIFSNYRSRLKSRETDDSG